MSGLFAELLIDYIRWWSLGFVGWLAHRDIIAWDTYRCLLSTFYAEPVKFIDEGHGLFHVLYCWFIMWSEGV